MTLQDQDSISKCSDCMFFKKSNSHTDYWCGGRVKGRCLLPSSEAKVTIPASRFACPHFIERGQKLHVLCPKHKVQSILVTKMYLEHWDKETRKPKLCFISPKNLEQSE